MSDNGARAARCRREAEGNLRCAELPHLPKEIADALKKEAERLLAKAAELAVDRQVVEQAARRTPG